MEDYVVGCTAHIWDRRAVGTIGSQYYAPDIEVHGAGGTTLGAKAVEQDTVESIAAYPDEFGRAEDVIWEQRGPDAFVSSHRVMATATHLGHSGYGAPTNRMFARHAIAHCLVRAGRIVGEWVVRDEARLVRDLGLSTDELVRAAAGTERAPWLLELPTDAYRTGASGPRPSDDADTEVLGTVQQLVEQVWNGRDHTALGDLVADDVAVHTTVGRILQGVPANSTEIMQVLSAFPDARMQVLDVAVHRDFAADRAARGVRVALIWLLTGTYTGAERWGARTGSPVRILGGSHFDFANGRITREYRVYDELAIRIEVARQHHERTAA